MSASLIPRPDLARKPMQGKYDGRKGNGNANFGRQMRARFKRELMDKAVVAISRALDDPDKGLEAAKFVIEQTIGKAPIATEETRRAIQDNRLQVAIQSLIVSQAQPTVAKEVRPTLKLTPPTDTGDDPSSRETPPHR